MFELVILKRKSDFTIQKCDLVQKTFSSFFKNSFHTHSEREWLQIGQGRNMGHVCQGDREGMECVWESIKGTFYAPLATERRPPWKANDGIL